MRQILYSQPTSNRIIPQDQKNFAIEIFKSNSQLQWKTWWKDEARVIKQWIRARSIKILAGGDYADLQRQSLYDKYTFVLWCTTVLNARDRIIEAGKRIVSFTKIIQDPKEACTDFLNKGWLQLQTVWCQIWKLYKY